MKRQIAIFMTVLMLAVLLFGCGEPEGGQSTPTSSGSTQSVSSIEAEKGATLKILVVDVAFEQWEKDAIESFKMQYPGVTVQVIEVDWKKWERELLKAEDPVDLVYIRGNPGALYYNWGILQPIQHYVNMENSNLQLKAMEESLLFDGNYYGASAIVDFGVVYYNRAILEQFHLEDPMKLYEKGQWTWDMFTQYAETIASSDAELHGYVSDVPELFLGANATSLVKQNTDGRFVLNIDDPAVHSALKMIQKCKRTAGWWVHENDVFAAFDTGKAAMLGTYTCYQNWIKNVNYGMVPMPVGPNNTSGVFVSSCTIAYGIGAGSDCPAHVGKLIDMLVDGEVANKTKWQDKFPSQYELMRQKPFCVISRDRVIRMGDDLMFSIELNDDIKRVLESRRSNYIDWINQANKTTS